MEYRAVGNRCAADIDELRFAWPPEDALAILTRKGFTVVDVDIIALARACIGASQYRRGARPSEAPAVVDCSGFVKWLYGQRGMWLPRRSIQQSVLGDPVERTDIAAGDLIFISGRVDYYLNDFTHGIGHVGIVTGEGTVIHAMNRHVGVVETSLETFMADGAFRGVRRYIPKEGRVLTFETPAHREVETADDLRWIILQSFQGMAQRERW